MMHRGGGGWSLAVASFIGGASQEYKMLLRYDLP